MAKIAAIDAQSIDGAVEAFAGDAECIVQCKEAVNTPADLTAQMASEALDPATSQALENMRHSPGDSLQLSDGIYRVLGWSGKKAAPKEVMVEVAGLSKIGPISGPIIIGGVVKWEGSSWRLVSIAPRKIDSLDPTQAERSVINASTWTVGGTDYPVPGNDWLKLDSASS